MTSKSTARNFNAILHLQNLWYIIRHVKFIGYQEEKKVGTLFHVYEYAGAERTPPIIALV